jgi:hypothetical protein
LKCLNENGNSTLFEVGGDVVFSDPMQTVEMGFKLVNLTFPNAGSYAIQLWCDGDLLMPRKINVIQTPKAP